MQLHVISVVAQTNHQITKCSEIKFGDLFMNGVNHRGKTPPDEFKVTTPKNPLLSKQVVTSKGNSIPYTNLRRMLATKFFSSTT